MKRWVLQGPFLFMKCNLLRWTESNFPKHVYENYVVRRSNKIPKFTYEKVWFEQIMRTYCFQIVKWNCRATIFQFTFRFITHKTLFAFDITMCCCSYVPKTMKRYILVWTNEYAIQEIWKGIFLWWDCRKYYQKTLKCHLCFIILVHGIPLLMSKLREKMSILEFLPSLINMNKTCNLLSLLVL